MIPINTDDAVPLPSVGQVAPSASNEVVKASGFPIVGVGASAGGLEAFTQLLKALPPDPGIALVLVQHLAPSHPSSLAEILSRACALPVTEVQGKTPVEPNHVYVIPPGRGMVIAKSALHLLPREEGTLHRPIDQFFRSLATDQAHRAIGVVLSGSASDGTLGLKAIKSEGGITFAQDVTAQQSGMPQSAIESGCVDFVLSPEAIALEMARIGRHSLAEGDVEQAKPRTTVDLLPVIGVLQASQGVDFSHYRFNTLYRRIARR
ncbi:MAG: chemotaxis protein CheB, partial [Vicinamibacteria bacterium]